MGIYAATEVTTLAEAALFALRELQNMTTEKFSKGGDKAIRESLAAALKAEGWEVEAEYDGPKVPGWEGGFAENH